MIEQKTCLECGTQACDYTDLNAPEFCISEALTEETIQKVRALYDDEENRKVSIISASVEKDFYCKYTRVAEIIEFARRMGYQKLGIATCVGLIRESRTLAKILRKHGFTVYGVVCKVGSFPKSSLGVDQNSRMDAAGDPIPETADVAGSQAADGRNAETTFGRVSNVSDGPGPIMCNPIMQAELLNAWDTDLNIVMGLCVGHDSLFYKYSDALVTTLVAKDRVLAHNPAGALYQANGYYRKLLR